MVACTAQCVRWGVPTSMASLVLYSTVNNAWNQRLLNSGFLCTNSVMTIVPPGWVCRLRARDSVLWSRWVTDIIACAVGILAWMFWIRARFYVWCCAQYHSLVDVLWSQILLHKLLDPKKVMQAFVQCRASMNSFSREIACPSYNRAGAQDWQCGNKQSNTTAFGKASW